MTKEAGKIVVKSVIAFVSVFAYLHALEALGIENIVRIFTL
jgi:hypothetical protein